MDRLRELARKVSNWGRWGADDQIGTLNFISPAHVQRAAGCVRRGDVFSLGLPLDADGPQLGSGTRVNPDHRMTAIGERYGPDFHFADDAVTMPLQCATQWDSLAHVWYDDRLYNGVPASEITAAGAARNSIDRVPGIVSRGVLLDVARAKGVERLDGGQGITPADLEAAERMGNVRAGTGDVILLRTGWMRVFRNDGDRLTFMKSEPGIGLDCVEWLHAREIAAVAADTQAVEVLPGEDPKLALPVHLLCIRDMGLTLGELFDLEALADDCARDGVYECFFTAPPLRITGAVGSPLNPLAIK